MNVNEEIRERYDAAKGVVEAAKDYLHRLTTKRAELSEGLTSLEDEISEANAEAAKAMKHFVSDKIDGGTLSEARRAVAALKYMYDEEKGAVDALDAEIEKAQQEIKEAGEELDKKKRNLFLHLATIEKERALVAGGAALKRAFLIRRRSSYAGYAPKLHDFIAEVFSMLHITDAEEAAIFSEVEKEYNFPMV
jgi:predicted RNase H-like nuclease (RuvC/YqgF family)